MKLFGTISELVAAVFRKNSQAVTMRPNQATTYTAARDIQLPSGDTDHVLVSRTSTDTLTNKTLTSPTITGGTVAPTSLTVADANFTIQDDADVTRQAKFQASGISTGTTRTYTFPDASTTLVGDTATQTLTNKTLSNVTVTGASTTIQDGAAIVDTADSTKRLQFDVGGTTGTFTQFTTAQTTNRTLTLPDATDTLVGKATTDTLTNKTLTSPTINTPTITALDTAITLQDAGDTTKQQRFDVSASQTTATTRTQTLPTTTGVLANDNNAITLANKSLEDSTTTLYDTADTSKLAKLDVPTGQTTATTRTHTLPAVDSTLAGIATTQVLTNKDIDGGTASNTSRVTLPKDTTTNINGLTRKQATLIYDTTTDQVKFDNGTTLSALSTTATATPTAQGSVTSYFPTIQSSTVTFTNADYTGSTTDGYETILMAPGATDNSALLPAAASNTGRVYLIKKTDAAAGAVVIDPNGSETVDGLTTYSLPSQNDSVQIVSDGSNWKVVAPGRMATSTLSGTVSSFSGGSQALASGTYTPTIADQVSVAASTLYVLPYTVVGKNVIISGRVDIDSSQATAVSTAVSFTLSVPSGFNISTGTQPLGGAGVSSNASDAIQFAKSTATKISVSYNSTTTANVSIVFTLQYYMD